LRSSTRGSSPHVLKRETFKLERGVSPDIKRENLNLKTEVSTCDSLGMTNNSRMLNEIPGILPKPARS